MIDKTEARKIAEELLAVHNEKREKSTLIVDETRIVEKDYGWIFFITTREYFETDDQLESTVGGLAIAVERHGGTFHELSLTPNQEATIADFEARYIAGFEHEHHQLTIKAIHDWDKTLDFLSSLHLIYASLRRNSVGVEVAVRSNYNREQLHSELQSLPFTFYHQSIRQYFRLFGAMRQSGCCDFDLSPNTRRIFGWVLRTEIGIELLDTEDMRERLKNKERGVL